MIAQRGLHLIRFIQKANQQIQRVHGLIDQRTAALRVPFALPVRRAVIIRIPVPGHKGTHAPQRAVCAVAQELLCHADVLIHAVLEADAQGDELPRLLDLLPAGGIDGGRLFGEHRHAPLRRRQRHIRMEMVRGAEVDEVTPKS